MRHRGPDGSGLVTHGRVVLGQTRLAIVDVQGGRQPLSDPAGRHVAVSNGEIYNHRELRRRFNDTFTFCTHSDAEVLLPAYVHLGCEGVRSLDGMFSYALSEGSQFYAARDPLGIKPLYYGHREGHLLVASEMRALAGEVDEIAEFPAGHYYRPGAGLVRYHRVPRRGGVIVDPDRAQQIVREALIAAVRSHLMADVPVGSFLSGGLDSSLLAMLASRDVKELHTFAVGMAGSPDVAAAETVARHIGSHHHVCEITTAMIEEHIEEIVMALESYDAALVRSAVPTWFVSQLAAHTRTTRGERIKVVLTGEGADEIFAGYDYLRDLHGPELENEIVRLLESLHNLNLQRVDRMTMAHSLEARVPFLGTPVVDRLMTIHPILKESQAFGQAKGILRKAFTGDLPDEILWRRKAEFAQGSSVSGALGRIAAQRVSDREWAQARRDGLPLRSREEVFYYHILKRSIGTPLRAGTIGRWRGPVL